MRIIALVGALAVCLDPVGAAPWPVPRGPSREPAPYRYDPAVWKTVPASFLDDAPACILLAATTHLVETDGTIETITHELTRLNSRKSIEKLGEHRGIVYDPAFQKVTLNVARVHKAGGKMIEVEPRHVHLRDVSTDYQVYNPDKQVIISFPMLEVGDVLEVKWTSRGKNPEHHGQFFTRYYLGDLEHPIVLDELRVRLPAGRSLRHACVNGKLTPTVTTEAGQTLYHWSARNLPQAPQDDDRPSKEELRPQVCCSTFASWEEVAQWKRKLRQECWECTAEVRRTVGEVTRGLATPREKARALTYWVRKNIRYLSAGERHDYTPHKPHDVLSNRQGDCKDTSQLLAVMLREAGVPSALVTLGLLDDGQVLEEVPSPWGTHGILLVTIDGKDHWIDTTATLSAWDFLPRACRDRLCYITDDKRIHLKRTPPLVPEENRFEATTEVSIAADGSTRARRQEVYHGLAALNQRDRWLEVPAGEQRRQAAAKLLDSNSGTRLHRLEIDETTLADLEKPLKASLEFTIPGQFSGKDRDSSFTDSRVWNYLLAYNLDPDRRLPLELSSPVESRHRFIVTVPAGFEFDGLPRRRTVKAKWGTLSREISWRGTDFRSLQIDLSFRLEKTRVEPADFAEYRRFHRDVGEAYRVWVALERVQQRKHLAEQEAIASLLPGDIATASLLAEQYLQMGDRAEARRVLKRTRFYHPDDLALLELSVKSAGSAEEAEKLQRELLARHQSDPTHAIALGAMLIDRGKQTLAVPVLEALTKSAPAAPRALAHYQLARANFAEKKNAEALEHLDRAAALEGGRTHLLQVEVLRGRVYEAMQRREDALKAYVRAHQADPRAEDALILVIEAALARDERGIAGEHLRRYAALAGNRIVALNRAADYALKLGWQQEAFDLASRSRDVGFSEAAQRILGLVHLQRGEVDRAIFHLAKAEPTAPVLEALIRAHLALGNLDAAERESRRAGLIPQPPADLKLARTRTQGLITRRNEILKQLGPDSAKHSTSVGYLVCAEELRLQRRTSARIEAMLARADGSLGPVQALKGLLSLEQGRLREALGCAEQAISASPADWRGWYVRGRVRLERLTLGGLADLEKAASLSQEKEAEVLKALAEAQTEAGHREAAQATLRKVAQLVSAGTPSP